MAFIIKHLPVSCTQGYVQIVRHKYETHLRPTTGTKPTLWVPWHFLSEKNKTKGISFFRLSTYTVQTPWHTVESEEGDFLKRKSKCSRSRRQNHRQENLWCPPWSTMIYAHKSWKVTTQRNGSLSAYAIYPDRSFQSLRSRGDQVWFFVFPSYTQGRSKNKFVLTKSYFNGFEGF